MAYAFRACVGKACVGKACAFMAYAGRAGATTETMPGALSCFSAVTSQAKHQWKPGVKICTYWQFHVHLGKKL